MNVHPARARDGAQVRDDAGKLGWKMEYTAGKDPATGKLRRLGERFYGTERQAKDYWGKRQAELDGQGSGFVKTSKETVGDFLRLWLRDHVEPHLKPSTARSYVALAKDHLIPDLGALALGDLARPTIAAWQADMLRKRIPDRKSKPSAENPKPTKPISPKRVLNALRALHSALAWGVETGHLATNPADHVRAPKQDPERVEAFTREEAERLQAALAGHRLEALFLLAWHTGLRLGELTALRWADVDLKAGTVRVERTASAVGGPVQFVTPKSRDSFRTVALTLPANAALRKHKTRQDDERRTAGENWQDNGLVFCTAFVADGPGHKPCGGGRPYHPGGIERVYYHARAKAGVPPHRFHALRHTYASLALSAGMRLEAVSEALGHSDVGFTKRTYAHFMLDAKRADADTFTAYLAGGASGRG